MKRVKILGLTMCRILNMIMYIIWTESNVNKQCGDENRKISSEREQNEEKGRDGQV